MAKKDKDEAPKPKPGECPNGAGDHVWVREGHDMKCARNCGARYTVD